ERRQPIDRLPQRLLHLGGLGRKELEGNADARRGAAMNEAARARSGGNHQATSRAVAPASAMRGSRPSQSETAILPSEFGSGGSVFCCSVSRPAALSHCV